MQLSSTNQVELQEVSRLVERIPGTGTFRFPTKLKIKLTDLMKLMTVVCNSNRGLKKIVKPLMRETRKFAMETDNVIPGEEVIHTIHRSFYQQSPPIQVLTTNLSKAVSKGRENFQQPEKDDIDVKRASSTIPSVDEVITEANTVPRKYREKNTDSNAMVDDLMHVYKILKIGKADQKYLLKAGIESFADLLGYAMQLESEIFLKVNIDSKVKLQSVIVWFYEFADKDDNKEPPPVLEGLTEEAWNEWTGKHDDEAELNAKFLRYNKQDSFFVGSVESLNYMNLIRKIQLPPLLIALFINTGTYIKKDDQEVVFKTHTNQVCNWSGPRVNNRSPELADCDNIRKSLFDENATMDFTEDYVLLPYVIQYPTKNDEEKRGEIICCMVNNDEKMVGHPVAKSLEGQLEESVRFFEFVCKMKYNEIYPKDTTNQPGKEDDDKMTNKKEESLYDPFIVFVRGLQHMKQKYGNLANKKMLSELYCDLMEYVWVNPPRGLVD